MLTKSDLKIATIASKDDTRPIIAAVQVKKIDQGLRLVATDGYHLTEKTIKLEDAPDFDEMLIPAKTLLDVAKLMGVHDRLTITRENFIIKNLKTEAVRQVSVGATTEGNYPEYQLLVPEKKSQFIALNARYISELMAVADADGGAVMVQIDVDEVGHINKLSPVRFDSESEGVKTVSVLMPLKQ